MALRAREALEQDGYLTITYRIRHRDGRYRWFETASRAIRETYTGAVVEVVSVSRDVTRRVEAEENRRRLAEVVEANTDLVLFVEHGGRVTYLNPSARAASASPTGRRRRRWNACWPATLRRGWPKRVGDRRAMAAFGAARGACNRRTGVRRCQSRWCCWPIAAAARSAITRWWPAT